MEKINEKTKEKLKKSREENVTDEEFPSRTGINKQPKLEKKTNKRKSHKSIQ
ncbi:MAG: hypothetical protein OEM28_11045 [Nitrosopumilus sp.]|nr:hypothetical protein [Nitrosopumilus sp.]MDH3488542.1 hypothetical protein [Nitrosopumilus sp.]